jgi:hypothetical protein
MATAKPVEERIKESMEIVSSLLSLGIPRQCAEMDELHTHLNAYIKDGLCWSGNIDFRKFGRIAEVDLPRRADKHISVNLRVPRVGK